MKMNTKCLNRKKILHYISLIFLFCFFLQILGFPNKIAILGGGGICVCYVLERKKLEIGIREGLLFLSLFLYALISKQGASSIIVLTMVPVVFAFLGKYNSVATFEENMEKALFCIIGCFVAGYFIHGFSNCIIYFQQGFLPGGRIWGDIWGKELLATHQNIYILPTLALMFPAFVYLKDNIIVYTGIILGGVFFLFQSVHSLSRIPVMVWIICILGGFVLFFIMNRHRENIYHAMKKIIIGLVIILVVSIFIVFLNYDTIQNLKYVQTLRRNGGILHNIRFKAQINVIRQLFVYPFGGYQMDLCGLEHCHNVWLDIANAAGIIPFILMVVYTIISVRDMIIFLQNDCIGNKLKYIVSELYLSLILYYMVEPALMADVRFFVPWTWLNGIVYGCILNCKNPKKELGQKGN